MKFPFKKKYLKLTGILVLVLCSLGSLGQNAWDVHTKAYAGFSRVKWSADNLGRHHGEKDRWSSEGLALGAGFHRFFTSNFFGGVEYDYHRINFADGGLNFADRCKLHEFKGILGYFRDPYLFFEGQKIRRFHLGYSAMTTLETNPFLIDFTSPYELRTKWAGWNFGLEFGHLFEVGDWGNNVQIAFTYDFVKLRMTRAWTASNNREINSSGEMNITEFGFRLTFMFGDVFVKSPGLMP